MTRLQTHKSDWLSREGLKSAPLREHLTAEVTTGRLKPGTRLPTEVEFADEYDISRQTVRRALAELEEEGLIRRERGRGTFVNKKVPKEQGQRDGKARAPDKAGRQVAEEGATFVLLLPDTHVYGLPIIRGFERACKASHDHMVVCSSENDLNLQGNLILQLLRKDIAGVAMMPATAPTPAYQVLSLQERGIPVVFCHRGVQGVRAPLLAMNYPEIGRLAGNALIEHGHRRVALFYPHRADQLEPVTRGFRSAIEAGRGELPDEFIYSPGKSIEAEGVAEQEEAVFEALQRICGDENPPTAIAAGHDSLAEMIYMLLPRLGIRVPQDISIISGGDVHREGPIARRLATIVFDESEMARQAADLLQQMQSGSRSIEDDETIWMPLSFQEGESLGPVPSHSVLPSLSSPSETALDTPT